MCWKINPFSTSTKTDKKQDKEKVEDAKGIIRSHKSKDQKKMDKITYETLHRKLRLSNTNPTKTRW